MSMCFKTLVMRVAQAGTGHQDKLDVEGTAERFLAARRAR